MKYWLDCCLLATRKVKHAMCAGHISNLFCLSHVYTGGHIWDVSLQLHLPQAVILVNWCHIALLHAIDTQKATIASRNHLNHDSWWSRWADNNIEYIVACIWASAEIVLLCRLAKHMLLYAIFHPIGMLKQRHADLTLVYMRWQCL